jgi:dienelactone hydrolase
VKRCWAGLVACVVGVAWAGTPVYFPGPGVELTGRMAVPEGKGPFPAIVMLHGCSGLWARRGPEPTPFYQSWEDHFRSRGYVTLLVDSFGPRGEKEICTQKVRRVSEARDRPRDAFAALQWLASQANVDAGRVHVMGWSNGASTVLNTVGPNAPSVSLAAPDFRSAVAFYPGCAVLARSSYRSRTPVLIQAGAVDDWTPARPCISMAQEARAAGVDLEIDVYEGAGHGFDGPGTLLRSRPEVRNPSNPTGWGATVGPHPAARARALERVTAWIESFR